MADMNILRQAMGDLEEERVLEIAREIAEDGGAEAVAAMEACQEA
jgi:hypothetical protein